MNDQRKGFRRSVACAAGNIKIHNRRDTEVQRLYEIINLLRNSASRRLSGYCISNPVKQLSALT